MMPQSNPMQFAPSILENLLDIGRQVLAEEDIDRILTRAMDGAIALTQAERGFIILFDHDGGSRFHTARNLNRQDLQRPKNETSRSIIRKVQFDKKPVFLQNALEAPEFEASKSVRGLKILSVICLPLLHAGELIGAVYLDNRSFRGIFSPEMFQFAQKFADFISVAAAHALEQQRLRDNVEALQRDLREHYSFGEIIGTHPAIMQILQLVAQVADTEATVLIQGETGTGKELIARALHQNSRRANRPFVAINCSTLQENLLESELFGHVKGAFTGATENKIGWFERAHGGTIFLDEVSEMSPALQLKLLRILQTGEFSPVGSTRLRHSNVRILAATNRNLQQLVNAGRFRDDVYYRLNVIAIEVPPLRDRASDILLLAVHFLDYYGSKYGKPGLRLSSKARAQLLKYHFPGNVRELENMMERAVILCQANEVEAETLPIDLGPVESPPPVEQNVPTFREAKQRLLQEFERSFILERLADSGGNISQAARASGMDVKNFYEKMKQHRIDARAFKTANKPE
ncbi:MAG: sigma 54-interacting transcriptional regulator [candidate division KSB1 bacterium]|nr:sigma 54-interacting transcriptional regulator [candidate division KSB1 bacterium]